MVVDCARDKTFRSVLALTPDRWKKICKKVYEPTPQALLESAMRHVDHLDRLNFDQFKVSVKAPDVFSLLSLIACWQNKSISRCIWGSPKPVQAQRAVKSAIGLGLLLVPKVSATRCAYRWRPIRSKRSKSALIF